MPWFEETSPRLWRFPERFRPVLPPGLFEAGKQTAGVRIRLRTDSPSLSMRATFPPFTPHPNMTQFSVQGISTYVDGKFWSSRVPPLEGGEVDLSLFATTTTEMRDICIYLPPYGTVEVESLDVHDESSFERPRPFSVDLPIVFYGTSITQGGCVSRPGLSYQARLSRTLNIDYVNMGFSGMGRCEESVAKIVSQIEASCYVIDVGQNNTPGELAQRLPPFIDMIRARRPRTPMLVTTPIFYAAELWSSSYRAEAREKRMIIESIVRERQRAGDDMIHLLSYENYMGPDVTDGSVDGAHPNDVGFERMARGLEEPLSRILGLTRAGSHRPVRSGNSP